MKYTKLIRILGAAIILLMLITALPSAPALAAEDIELDYYQGKVGDNITVTGTSFQPGAEDNEKWANVYFAKGVEGEVIAVGDFIDTDVLTYEYVGGEFTDWADDPNPGEFVAIFPVPEELTDGSIDADVVPGTYYICVTITFETMGEDLRIRSVAQFTVSGGDIALDVTQGPVDTPVTITGTGFAGSEDITIEYDGVGVAISGDTDTTTDSSGAFESTIIIPPSTAGAHTITVTIGSSEAEAQFTVEPDIFITPQSGKAGDVISISGDGFGGLEDISIFLNESKVQEAATTNKGSFTAQFIVPAGLVAGTYLVEAMDIANTASASFNVTVPSTTTPPSEPALTVVDGSGDTVGSLATILGTDFAPSETVTIEYDDEVLGTIDSDATGTFVFSFNVPESQPGAHTITATDETGNEADVTFTVAPPAPEPTLIIVEGSGDTVGSLAAVLGNDFAPNETVTIEYDDEALGSGASDSGGTFVFPFYVPESQSGEHTITATDETGNEAEVIFTVAPPATTTPATTTPATTTPATTTPALEPGLSLAPGSGNTIGSLAAVLGINFASEETVTVEYDSEVLGTADTDISGTFVFTFYVPESQSGAHTITATDETGNEAEVTLTVESSAPGVPTLVEPREGAKMQSPVSFVWGAVSDLSEPVTYNLQIANDKNFTATSILLEKAGLAVSSYILTEEEEMELAGKDALYWRVRALDAALNESPWATAIEFYIAGPFSFPSWATYTLISVGAILVFFIGFWVGRRTTYYY